MQLITKKSAIKNYHLQKKDLADLISLKTYQNIIIVWIRYKYLFNKLIIFEVLHSDEKLSTF